MNTQPITAFGMALIVSLPVAAQGSPCEDCGPGRHFIDTCAAGVDEIGSTSATVGIDFDLDCIVDESFIIPPCLAPDDLLFIARTDPLDVSLNFPTVGVMDGHLDVIDTEILSMCLDNGVVSLVAGAGQGAIPLQATLGAIRETAGDTALAHSFFDVFFEVGTPFGSLYNQEPLRLVSDISCIPPMATYVHLDGCIPLFPTPFFMPGQAPLANLISAKHDVNECFLVLGAAPGDDAWSWTQNSHLFETQVEGVQQSYPVLMDNMPDFPISELLPEKIGPRMLANQPTGGLVGTPGVQLVVHEFVVQVVMWNPLMFPGQPEKHTNGLLVAVYPDGEVVATPYGESVGMDIWAETDVDEQGQKIVRFPFSIDGL